MHLQCLCPLSPKSDREGQLARARSFISNQVVQDSNQPAGDTEPTPLNRLLLAVGRERDRVAFASLFTHFAPRLKAYMRFLGTDPQIAEELVQEVMLQVWRRAETFDPTRSSASTWVFAIARNKRIDAFRRESRPEIHPDDPALTPNLVELTNDALEIAEANQHLQAAIGDLPLEQQELLRLAYFEGKSHTVIASERGIPLGTVKSRLRAGLSRLCMFLRNLS